MSNYILHVEGLLTEKQRKNIKQIKEIHMKIVIVGNSTIGKTCFLITYIHKQFPSNNYMPRVWDNYLETRKYQEIIYHIKLFDTAGEDDFDRLRPLTYLETNVFVLCFSIVDRRSFENIKKKWIKEIMKHCPKTPYVLCGMKMDLREDRMMVKELKERNEKPVTRQEGIELAKEIKAYGYYECSSIKKNGLKEIIDECCRIQMYVRFLTVEKRRFFIFKKRNDIINKQTVVWEKSNDDLRKIIGKADLKRLDELKCEIKESRKINKELYIKYYSRLSRDVVKHILFEFVLVDFKSLYEFHPNYEYFVKELGLDKEMDKIQQKFFGYFKEEREKIIQLFYCFKVYSNIQLYKYIPKRKKLIIISNISKPIITESTIMKYIDYYSGENILLLNLLNVTSEEFGKLIKFCEISLKKLRINTVKSIFKRICVNINKCLNLEQLEVIKRVNIKNIHDQRFVSFDDELKLPKLKYLMLENINNIHKISFEYLPNLEFLKLNTDCSLTDCQYRNLKKIKSLKKVIFGEIGNNLNEFERKLIKCYNQQSYASV